jgi:hypothetical protein
MKLLVLSAALIAGCVVSPLRAEEKLAARLSTIEDGGFAITVSDLTPRFLDFYRAAQDLAPDARFTLWKRRYDFAAVPPTPEGEVLARRMLDEAWPRYGQALPAIEAGAGAMAPAPLPALREVAGALGMPPPFAMKLVVYVGGFEGNAYTMMQDGVPVVPCIFIPSYRTPRGVGWATLFPCASRRRAR